MHSLLLSCHVQVSFTSQNSLNIFYFTEKEFLSLTMSFVFECCTYLTLDCAPMAWQVQQIPPCTSLCTLCCHKLLQQSLGDFYEPDKQADSCVGHQLGVGEFLLGEGYEKENCPSSYIFQLHVHLYSSASSIL